MKYNYKKFLFFSFFIFLSSKIIKYFFINDREVPFAIKFAHIYLIITDHLRGLGTDNFQRNYFFSFLTGPRIIKMKHLTSEEMLINMEEASSLIDEYKIKHKIIFNKKILDFDSNKKFPTIIYIKGGGFVLEGFETNLFRHFTDKGFIFIIVYYRLAPEFKFPTQIEDCFSFMDYLAKLEQNENQQVSVINRIDKKNLILLGDSAGGNLVASLSILINTRRLNDILNIKNQIFMFPTFFYLKNSASKEKYSNWYLLDSNKMKWFARQYLKDPEKDKQNKLLSPLLYEDEILKKNPSSYFILCERDPLFSEGEYYRDKLLSLGVDVISKSYPAEHGFIFVEKLIKEADYAIKELKEYLFKKFQDYLIE